MRLAQGGDERAFQALVVKYQRRIARHVARYVRRAADTASKVVQDAFIRAYRGLASFRGESSFYSWLYRIATNAAFSFLKKTAGEVQADERSDEGSEPGLTDEQSPERILIARQIGETVERAMARLQPEEPPRRGQLGGRRQSYRKSRRCSARRSARCARIFRARDFIARRLRAGVVPRATGGGSHGAQSIAAA